MKSEESRLSLSLARVFFICYALYTLQKQPITKPALITIPKWLKCTLIIVITLAAIGYFLLGWIITNKLVAINPQKVEYDQTITAIHGSTYNMRGSAYDVNGVIGGIQSNGSMIGIFGPPTNLDKASMTSTRNLVGLPMTSASVGDKISLQGNIWTTDPLKALGVSYQAVTYQAPLGTMNAWQIRPASPASGRPPTTWTIGVHGIGADKTEMMRFVKPVIAADNTMLIINYRNDIGNPRSPDNRNHLSDTEWQDLQAAVRYAKAQGATSINLYGDSLGGSIVENYLARSSDVTTVNINKVVLDSPALNWEEVIKAQLSKGGYPSLLYYPASTVLTLRTGIRVSKISTKADEVKHKTLIIHNSDDKTVPQSASKQLATGQPDLVTLVDFGSGGHLRAWNHDQQRYEKLVTDFLQD